MTRDLPFSAVGFDSDAAIGAAVREAQEHLNDVIVLANRRGLVCSVATNQMIMDITGAKTIPIVINVYRPVKTLGG